MALACRYSGVDKSSGRLKGVLDRGGVNSFWVRGGVPDNDSPPGLKLERPWRCTGPYLVSISISSPSPLVTLAVPVLERVITLATPGSTSPFRAELDPFLFQST